MSDESKNGICDKIELRASRIEKGYENEHSMLDNDQPGARHTSRTIRPRREGQGDEALLTYYRGCFV